METAVEFVWPLPIRVPLHQILLNAGILHRDINSGNLLVADNEGIFLDLDLSVSTKTFPSSSRPPGLTGTWPFISAKLLLDTEIRHEREDDLESFYHVLTWVALRYTAHNLNPEELSSLMEMYDETFCTDSGTKGGRLKSGAFLSGEVPEKVVFTDCKPLNDLIKELTTVFAVRYRNPEDLEFIRRVKANPYSASVLKQYPDTDYLQHEENLAAEKWMVETIRRHLRDRNAWLEADKATPQASNSGTMSSRDHASDQAQQCHN
ncbi:hypothetical protein BD410DRAFT_713885 [Rickenella mellea]|uniref:Protein kinase domain-containing protein n=1 Tax=Rickenella mellea TaxID=50990 RepID=A0A4Y7QIU6_9AGAM|nr:hypothetical protein BD410DRAFT_713885 [Rickenella mellea]